MGLVFVSLTTTVQSTFLSLVFFLIDLFSSPKLWQSKNFLVFSCCYLHNLKISASNLFSLNEFRFYLSKELRRLKQIFFCFCTKNIFVFTRKIISKNTLKCETSKTKANHESGSDNIVWISRLHWLLICNTPKQVTSIKYKY